MWLTNEQLKSVGFAAIGSDVRIDASAVIFRAGYIRVGSHVRIDAFSDLSAGPGELIIGDHVHLAAAVHIFAAAGVTIASFAGLASGASVYSVSDKYSGGALTNPTVPTDLRDVTAGPVSLGRYVVVGAGSVILPGVSLGEGAAVGALTLVHRSVPENVVVSGHPMRQVGIRDGARLRALEAEVLRRERA